MTVARSQRARVLRETAVAMTNLDPKHWRDRAAATRARADQIKGEDQKAKLLRVAEEYERLAYRAEQAMT
jgi:hypothetical protein